MLALGGWFFATSLGAWLPGWLPVVAMCLCIFADAAGYQPVPYVITSELFSFQVSFLCTLIFLSKANHGAGVGACDYKRNML